jgi:hypothetical protein
MNTLFLLIGAQPWKTSSSLALLTRVWVVISVFSLEMQIVTWLQVGSIRTLPVVNAGLAILALVAWRPLMGRLKAAPTTGSVRVRDAVPLAATLVLGALVVGLNLWLPLEAADPYHLEKIEGIEQAGTLAYDPDATLKVNVVGAAYELLLADLRQVPVIGPWLVRLHGLWGLLGYLVAIAAVRELLGASPPADVSGADMPAAGVSWRWAALLVVPVLFHQLVLIKNDLFVAIPALVVLTWIITRSKAAPWLEIVWASWLAGFAVAVKLSTLPLLLVLGGATLVQRRNDWKALAGVALGTLVGAAAGGLMFALAENARVYGSLMPIAEEGNRNTGLAEALVGVTRFVISLVDFGRFTRVWWPGRGGWGGTFGLPLLWAVAVLAWHSRRQPRARGALICAGVYFLAFAGAFQDSDLTHRIVLAPALLVLATAVSLVEHGGGPRVLGMALGPVVAISSAQLARSAWLYFMR